MTIIAPASGESWLRWRGILGGEDRRVRGIVLCFLAVTCFSLTYMQLGFVGVGGSDGAYATYLLSLLAPISAGALMCGAGCGALLGCFSGAVILAHASFLPLDLYESYTVTPLNSVMVLAAIGALMGLLFAWFARRDLRGAARVAAILVTTAAGSACFSLLFMLNTSIWYAASGYAEDLEFIGELMGGGFGVVLQMALDAALMFVCCWAVDAVNRRRLAKEADRSLRAIFQGWLLLVVTGVFLLASSIGFTIVTLQCLDEADEQMRSETAYLANQLNDPGRASIEHVLDGYAADYDGLVAVFKGGEIVLSDGEGPDEQPGVTVEEFIGGQEHLDELVECERLVKTRYFGEGADGATSSLFVFLWVERAGDYDILVAKPSSMVYAERQTVMAWIAVMALLLLAATFLLATKLLDQVVVRRIDETNIALDKITGGDLDEHVDVRDSREFASLSAGINSTVGALRESINEVTARVESELATAKAIQESSLPRTFPPFPEVDRFDIYASMHPARQVGGDFYDFFLIGSHRLGVVMADVSGKGVPAALFMMTAKTQIQNYMEAGIDLVESVETANHQLCAGNDAGMFVTAFAGVLDYESGHLEYVNAGHNPSLLRHDGQWRWLTDRSGLPLGVFEGVPYEKFELDLAPHDMLYLYTDGVTEAMDPQGRLFGEERLERLLAELDDMHPARLVGEIRRRLELFADGAEQSDDITMLALEFGVASEVRAEIEVEADVGNLPQVLGFVHAELGRRLCPVSTQNQLDIAIEELFVNIAHYAYAGAPEGRGKARVSYTYKADSQSIVVELSDSGVPFDPLAQPDAVTPDDIMDVPVGGLGILMAKKSVDELAYRREGGRNIVIMRKSW